MTDQLGGGSRSSGLGILDMPGQRFDNFGIERHAFRRNQRRALSAVEVIGHHHAVVAIGDDQVVAGPRIVTCKQQMRIGNGNGAGEVMMGQRIDVDMLTGMRTEAVRFKLPGEIQKDTVKS